MAEITKHFRKQSGDQFTFRYVKQTTFWDIYCESKPPNTRYSNNSDITHIFEDNRLCITNDRRPRTFEQAVARSWQWLHGWSTFIRTGQFPNNKVRVITPDYDEDGNRLVRRT